MKKCKACKEINNDNAEFCFKCGNQFSNFTPLCPDCKSIITPDDVFCNKCGKRIIESDLKQEAAKKETSKYKEKPAVRTGGNRNFKIFIGLIGGFITIAVIAVILVFVIDISNLTSPFKSTTEVKYETDSLEEAITISEDEEATIEEDKNDDLEEIAKETTDVDDDEEEITEKDNEEEETVILDISPDRIVFISDRDGDFEVYAMDFDGSNQVQLTDNDSWDNRPSWSPDGKKIAFDSDRDGDSEIYIMDPNGSNLVQLTYNDSEDI